MAQFPANIDLSSLDGSNGFKISAIGSGNESGFSLASAGDINHDGFDDVIVSSRLASPHGANSGQSYVIFGKAAAFDANVQLSSLDGSNGFRLNGAEQNDFSGGSVASAGDVNGDGFDDLIIGAFGADVYGTGGNYHRSSLGASYVVFGKASGFAADVNLSSLDGSNGFKITGVAEGDRSGYSVASAGDVNGDGFADLIIGAPDDDPPDAGTGASYVVFGKASGFGANIDLSSLNGSNGFRLSGVGTLDWMGFSVASAGDLNGDGFADLIIGAYGADPHGKSSGASYVVFGKASGFAANLKLSSLNGSNGFKLSGSAEGDKSGFSVASAGDVNADGFADLIVGAPGVGVDAGKSYVVFGKASGFATNLDLLSLDGSNGFQISGAVNDRNGWSVASAGDVNGDGYADLIVGSQGNGNDRGAAFVVFGKASGFAANLDLSSLDGRNGFKITGEVPNDHSGWSVASAGDVNNDGFADLMMGAPFANSNGPFSGASYVIYGRAPDTAVNRVGTLASQTLAGGAFGDTLSGLAGDDSLYGNGGDDLLHAGAGDDTLYGGDGNDALNGSTGIDRAFGGAGDDTYTINSSADQAIENANEGHDTILAYTAFTLSDNVEDLRLVGNARIGTGNALDNHLSSGGGADTLSGLDGNDRLDGLGGSDLLDGGSGDDRLIAGDGNDTLKGGDGTDRLEGQNGIDTLDGGAGNDTLIGGAGRDVMTGGLGTDFFTFQSVADFGGNTTSTADRILDFSAAEGDRFHLSAIDANSNTAANDPFTFIGTTNFSGTAGQLRTFQQASDTFFAGDVNGDSSADFMVRVVGLHALAAGNFVL